MLAARSDTAYVTPWQIGTACTRAGEPELALDSLERELEEHDQNIPYLSVDPIFDYLRDEPRFRAMMASPHRRCSVASTHVYLGG